MNRKGDIVKKLAARPAKIRGGKVERKLSRDALHSKMFQYQIKYYSKEEIPTYSRLMNAFEKNVKSKLSRRVTSGICDAIVNKAVFHVYNLSPKHEMNLFEA